MRYFIFIFRKRYRNFFLNNFAKSRKINNYIIINLSGPILSILGKFLYLFLNKKVTFISCDGDSFLFNEKKSINIWMGGTSKKIDTKYLKFSNNYVTSSNIFTDKNIVLQVYPERFEFFPLNKDFKFIYASTFVKPKLKKSLLIWQKYKNKIMIDTTVIDKRKFWSLIKDINKEESAQIYIDLKNLIRFQYIKIINKKYNKDLILIGSNWKKYYLNSVESNFSSNFINSHYKGNVGLDFGSRDGDEVLYSRSVQILENKGLLIQSKQNSVNHKFLNLYKKICFKNPKELMNICETFKKNPKYANDILKKLVYFFNKKNYNLETLSKITF
jgi:hypothetical protein